VQRADRRPIDRDRSRVTCRIHVGEAQHGTKDMSISGEVQLADGADAGILPDAHDIQTTSSAFCHVAALQRFRAYHIV
jgi:hypothetical protein